MRDGFLMPACQWFALKIEQAIQKSEQTVQFFIDGSSEKWNSLNIESDKNTLQQIIMSKHTIEEIATNYALWMEYVDTDGHDFEEAFNAMTLGQKMDMILECFGVEVE